MENRAYEDEPNKSAHHHHLTQQHLLQHQQQQQQQQQQQFNLGLNLGVYQPPQQQHQQEEDSPEFCEHGRQYRMQQQHRFNAYRGMEMVQHGSECHVYEDIVAPYGLALEPGGAGAFHRNLTLPLRRTSQSCESIEGISSSVRVTNRERTRGSVIDRLTRDDRNCSGGSSRDESLVSGSSVERPARRRRKKDCKHCKVKAGGCSSEEAKQHQQQRQEQLAAYEERSAELRAIFGLPGLCGLAPGCLSAGVVYAIGCNGTDCNGSLVSSSLGGTNSDSTTTTSTAAASAVVVPRFAGQESSFDEKTLIAPLAGPKQPQQQQHGAPGPGCRAAGMKVNSIYAQEHWHAKDPRIFLNDPKEQNCNFQRAYTAVSSNSPSSENRANLRRSVRDDPAPHPARLRKNRHGWTLQFGRPLAGTNCTKSFVLLLILVLTLLGIGGFALYIVFEPEKLHVIQQYLRSSARNSSSPVRSGSMNYGTTHHRGSPEEPVSSTSLPTSSLLDVLLNSSNSVNSLNSNNLPEANDLNENEPVFVTAWTTSSSTHRTTAVTSTTAATTTTTTTTSRSTSKPTTWSTTTTTTTPRPTASLAFLEAHSRRRRPCAECYGDEVCVARNADETPYCRAALDPADRSGCGGLCDDKNQKCHKLDGGAFRCTEIEHHCLDDEWTCLNIFCIPSVKRCDGQMNCYDHSDEYNCECNLETHFHCGNQTSCLPLSKKCDGHVDCFDATDEENCTTSHELGRLCPSTDEFTCRSKQQCIKRSRFCDGYRDCKDGSDEPHGCQGRCNKHEFACHNGRCINKADKCNGIDDCGDSSDEQHCRERL